MTRLLVFIVAIGVTILASTIQSVIFVLFWSQCHQLFPALPEVWHGLNWWTTFCLFACANSMAGIFKSKKVDFEKGL